MWTNALPQMFFYIVMAAMVRMIYDLSSSPAAGAEARHMPATMAAAPGDYDGLTHQQREWADRAVERYRETQGKKWRRWNEVMFK